MKLHEVYSRSITGLRNYMRDKDFDLFAHLYEVAEWLEESGQWERIGIDPQAVRDAADSPEEHQELISKLQSRLDKDDIQEIIEIMMRDDPVTAPTWAHADQDGYNRPSDWLIHFTDDAAAIKSNGFKYGVQDMSILGLTKHMSKSAKRFGGYNFAFQAQSKYADLSARDGKYGDEAVMFRAGGVKMYHYGDEEPQVAFLGSDVPTASIVTLFRSGQDWVVPSAKGGRDLYIGPFRGAVNWVMKHERQYRKSLY